MDSYNGIEEVRYVIVKKALEFILVLSIILFGCFCIQRVSANKEDPKYKTVFKDNFNNGKLDGWTIGGQGTWSVQNKKLTQTDTSLDGDWNERPTIIANEVTVSDNFIIETKFNLISGQCAIIRFKCSQDLRNCLFVAMWEGTTIIIGEVVDNIEISSIWYNCPFERGIEHNLIIKVLGPTIEIYVDSILRASDNNYGTVYQSGKFGFTTYISSVTYDDVRVSTIKQPNG